MIDLCPTLAKTMLDVDAIQHAEKLLFSLIVFKVLLTKWDLLTLESEQAKLDKNVHMMPQKQLSMK